jgi:hypothetical protein
MLTKKKPKYKNARVRRRRVNSFLSAGFFFFFFLQKMVQCFPPFLTIGCGVPALPYESLRNFYLPRIKQRTKLIEPRLLHSILDYYLLM